MDQSDARFYDDDLEIDLRRYAALMWQHKWLLILGVVLAAGAAFAVSKPQTPIYQASTTLFINQAPTSNTSDYNAVLTSERLAQTYSKMLTQRPILEATLKDVGLVMPVEDFEKTVNVQLLTNTQLIEVQVENPNPGLASQLANALAAAFETQTQQLQTSRYAASKESLQNQLDSLQADIQSTQAQIDNIGSPQTDSQQADLDRLGTNLTQLRASYANVLQSYEQLRLAEAQSVSNVSQIQPATPPIRPVRPRTLLNTLLAAVVGGMLALGGVFLMDYLDDSVKQPEQIERQLGLPLIGMIANVNGQDPQDSVYVAQAPRSPVAEAFRNLRTNLRFASVDDELRTILVTSADPEVGKSTVAANLAAILAQGGKKVIILDGDMRRPRLHRVLGVDNHNGLSELFVENNRAAKDRIQSTGVDGLSVVTSGALPPNPAELLGSKMMIEILEGLATQADMVVLDSPPAGVVTDAVVMAPRVDGVILVVQPGKTKLPILLQAVELLRRSGANLLGVVFNNVPLNRAGYYGGYRYQYAYGNGLDGKERAGSAR